PIAGSETATMFESSMIRLETNDDVSKIQNPLEGAAAWFWSAIAVMTLLRTHFCLPKTVNANLSAQNLGAAILSIPTGYRRGGTATSPARYAAVWREIASCRRPQN